MSSDSAGHRMAGVSSDSAGVWVNELAVDVVSRVRSGALGIV